MEVGGRQSVKWTPDLEARIAAYWNGLDYASRLDIALGHQFHPDDARRIARQGWQRLRTEKPSWIGDDFASAVLKDMGGVEKNPRTPEQERELVRMKARILTPPGVRDYPADEPRAAHTPGPWRIGDAMNTIFGPPTGAPSPETVAHVAPTPNRRANARLIAAAPELEDHLRKAQAALGDFVTGHMLQEHSPRESARLMQQARNAAQPFLPEIHRLFQRIGEV